MSGEIKLEVNIGKEELLGGKYIAWGHFCRQEEEERRKWKKIFGEGKHFFGGGEKEPRGKRR